MILSIVIAFLVSSLLNFVNTNKCMKNIHRWAARRAAHREKIIDWDVQKA